LENIIKKNLFKVSSLKTAPSKPKKSKSITKKSEKTSKENSKPQSIKIKPSFISRKLLDLTPKKLNNLKDYGEFNSNKTELWYKFDTSFNTDYSTVIYKIVFNKSIVKNEYSILKASFLKLLKEVLTYKLTNLTQEIVFKSPDSISVGISSHEE